MILVYWYQEASLSFIVLFDIKGEERFLPLILSMILFVYPFVDDWQKGGEDFVLFRIFWLPLLDPFVFDKKGENIICVVLIDIKGEERFLPLILFMVLIVYPFVDDWQKGGERFGVLYICIFMFLHILSLI